MTKTRINSVEGFAEFRQEQPKRWTLMDRTTICSLMDSIHPPQSYPAILVWSIEDDPDDGLFIVYEWVYPEEFSDFFGA